MGVEVPELYALKRKTGTLPKDQDAELTELSDRLEELGFSRDFRDPMYQLFVERMAVHTRFHKEQLSPKEIAEQDKLADAVIDEILEKKG